MLLSIILTSAPNTDDTNLYYKCNQASYSFHPTFHFKQGGGGIFQRVCKGGGLRIPKSELEVDGSGVVWWWKRFSKVNARNTLLVSFDYSKNFDTITVKMDMPTIDGKSNFKMLGFSSTSELDCGLYTASIAETASKKLSLHLFFSFFLVRLCFISINLTFELSWNTVLMS